MDTVLDTHQYYKILVNFSKLYLKETKMQRNVRFYKYLPKLSKGVQVPLSPLNAFKTPANCGGSFFYR